MLYATSNGNPCTTIISCNCPTNVSDETDIIFYNDPSFLVRHIPKHYILIIGGAMNSLIGKDENNKFCLYNLPNRNGEYLAEFSLENRSACLNIKFLKSYEHTPTQITLKHN